MQRLSSIISLGFVLFVGLGAAGELEPTIVRGKVYDQESRAPLVNVFVEVFGVTPPMPVPVPLGVSRTDDDGAYTVEIRAAPSMLLIQTSCTEGEETAVSNTGLRPGSLGAYKRELRRDIYMTSPRADLARCD